MALSSFNPNSLVRPLPTISAPSTITNKPPAPANLTGFRAYLNTVDPSALAFTGNNGGIDPTKAGYDTKQGSYINNANNLKTVQQYITGLYNKYLNPAKPTAPQTAPSIYGGGGYAPAPIYAPKYDTAALAAQARKAAIKGVSPFYQSQLNSFLKEQAAQKQQFETQNKMNVTNLEDQLKNTLEQNEINRTRTAEDVAANQAEIATTADEFQADAGQEFDATRMDIARNASTGGLGAQQVEGAQKTRNTAEARQVQKFKQAREQQDLFKNRSFDDLARSGKLAGESTEKGKQKEKFDLESFQENIRLAEKSERNRLETAKQADISRQQHGYAQKIFNQYLNTLSNPQRVATIQTYGSSF